MANRIRTMAQAKYRMYSVVVAGEFGGVIVHRVNTRERAVKYARKIAEHACGETVAVYDIDNNRTAI